MMRTALNVRIKKSVMNMHSFIITSLNGVQRYNTTTVPRDCGEKYLEKAMKYGIMKKIVRREILSI